MASNNVFVPIYAEQPKCALRGAYVRHYSLQNAPNYLKNLNTSILYICIYINTIQYQYFNISIIISIFVS